MGYTMYLLPTPNSHSRNLLTIVSAIAIVFLKLQIEIWLMNPYQPSIVSTEESIDFRRRRALVGNFTTFYPVLGLITALAFMMVSYYEHGRVVRIGDLLLTPTALLVVSIYACKSFIFTHPFATTAGILVPLVDPEQPLPKRIKRLIANVALWAITHTTYYYLF